MFAQIIASAAVAAVAAHVPIAHAQVFVGFAPQVTFLAGTGPLSVALGDLNGDGVLDLASANQLSANVSVLLGDGVGGFAPQQTFQAEFFPRSVAMADFNGDGALDLVVADGGFAGVFGATISVLLGDGAGGFAPQQTFPAQKFPQQVATGDLNGDGDLDIAVVNLFAFAGSGQISILFGDGAGDFAPQVTFGAGTPQPDSIAIGDLNGDGDLDLAVANYGGFGISGNVSVFLGDGAGSFAPPQPFSAGVHPSSVAIGDLDGDGVLDLAVANQTSNNISILLGDGAGDFAPQVAFPVGTTPVFVAIGDLEGDGDLDLAVANKGSANVSILLGDGAGGFAPQQTFPVGLSPASVAIGDLDGDSAPDLAVANASSNNISILINQTPFPTGNPADLNGDGTVDGADLATLLTQWGTNGAADLNGDGTVDGADLAQLLTNWGPV